MSKILNELIEGKTTVTECLQRLLVIATRTKNVDLANWCEKELKGYKTYDELPNYRKFKNSNIVYSGINGNYQITNSPILPGFLNQKTLEKIEKTCLFDNIEIVEKAKDSKERKCRDLTFLAGEVAKNTKEYDFDLGVQCTSIQQVFSPELYANIYSEVKTRIINLLVAYEEAGINLDALDIKKSKQYDIEENNQKMFNIIIVDGKTYIFPKKEKKILWNVVVPVIVGIVSTVLGGLIMFFITKYFL